MLEVLDRSAASVLMASGFLQITMGSLSLIGGWEVQNGALQSLGIDMFAQAQQASLSTPSSV